MTFSNEIIKILDDLSKRFGIAIDWGNKTIMPYLNGLIDRYIKWDIATSIIAIVVGVALIVIGVCIARYMWKHRKEYSYFGDLDEGVTWKFIFAVVGAIIGAIIVIYNCCSIVEAIYLPEMRIYGYIQCLISTK